jgi:hypothetical protein
MAQKFVILINELHARFQIALKITGAQAMKFYTKFKRRVVTKCLPARDSCNDPRCNWSNIFSKRFGIDNFPCIQTIQNSEIHAPNPPTFPPATINSGYIVESYNGGKWDVMIYSAKNTPKLPFSESDLLATNNDDLHNSLFTLISLSTFSFVSKLTQDILRFYKSNKAPLLRLQLMVDLAYQFGEKKGRSGVDESDLAFRSEFYYEQLKLHHEKSKEVSLTALTSDFDVQVDLKPALIFHSEERTKE